MRKSFVGFRPSVLKPGFNSVIHAMLNPFKTSLSINQIQEPLLHLDKFTFPTFFLSIEIVLSVPNAEFGPRRILLDAQFPTATVNDPIEARTRALSRRSVGLSIGVYYYLSGSSRVAKILPVR